MPPSEDPARGGMGPEPVEPTATGSTRSASTVLEPQTRRALVSSAVEGLQNFKQSWISVMLLKASIGLGQVIALLVLLVLASTLASPLYPEKKQTSPSDQCPRPGLFISWMSINMARLVVCWLVSCWMLVRKEQRRRRRARMDAERRELEDEIAVREQERQQASRRERQADLQLACAAAQAVTNGEKTVDLKNTEKLCTAEKNDKRLSAESRAELWDGPSSTATSSSARLLSPDVSWAEEIRTEKNHPKVAARSQDELIHLPVLDASSTSLRNSNSPDPRASRRGAMPTDESGADLLAEGNASRLSSWLDRSALTISKSLGVISTVLFILGNVLLFYPAPSNTTGCYAASPMLWWGVMVVTGVGWVLFAQVFFIAVIVGLGGQVVFAALRRLGILAEPPGPEPPRAPQPDPLTTEDLHLLRISCFVPHKDAEGASKLDMTRLPYPPVYLDDDKALCVICQENFKPPAEGRTIMLKAQPLRQLGCGHSFHTGCIDRWLLKGSANCPFCKYSIRDGAPFADKSTVRRFGDGGAIPDGDATGNRRWFRRSPRTLPREGLGV